MVKPQLGHDQVVSEERWSLNTGGHKSRFHCMHNKLWARSNYKTKLRSSLVPNPSFLA